MGSEKEIGTIGAQREIYQCPSCNYSEGFHISFELNQKSWEAELYLICPGCKSRFRMGLKMPINPVRGDRI